MRRDSLVERAVLLGLLALLVIVGTSCAEFWDSLKRDQEIQEYIDARTREHVYQKPIEQLWPEVRKLLFEGGFEVKDSGVGGSFAVETAPRPSGVDSVERYLVLGTKLGEGSCRVEFTKQTTVGPSSSSTRDLELEWKLLQHADPESARRIESEAKAAAKD